MNNKVIVSYFHISNNKKRSATCQSFSQKFERKKRKNRFVRFSSNSFESLLYSKKMELKMEFLRLQNEKWKWRKSKPFSYDILLYSIIQRRIFHMLYLSLECSIFSIIWRNPNIKFSFLFRNIPNKNTKIFLDFIFFVEIFRSNILFLFCFFTFILLKYFLLFNLFSLKHWRLKTENKFIYLAKLNQ